MCRSESQLDTRLHWLLWHVFLQQSFCVCSRTRRPRAWCYPGITLGAVFHSVLSRRHSCVNQSCSSMNERMNEWMHFNCESCFCFQTSAGWVHHWGVQTACALLRLHHQPLQVCVCVCAQRRTKMKWGPQAKLIDEALLKYYFVNISLLPRYIFIHTKSSQNT